MALRQRTKKLLAKKQTISQEEYDRLEQESRAAHELLSSGRFQFFRDYLDSIKTSITQSIVENRITEVHEELTVSDRLKRVFVTPKKVQLDELAGQYKLVDQILTDLKATEAMKDQLEDAIEKREVHLEGDTDDEE